MRPGIHINLAGFIVLISLLGCATSGGSTNFESDNYNNGSVVRVDDPSLSLVDYLRRVPGVRIIGDGPGARIIIREKRTFASNSTPLFVINGRRAGKDFSSVYYLVNMADVTEIEVIKGTDTSLYGMDGANGVILISTQ